MAQTKKTKQTTERRVVSVKFDAADHEALLKLATIKDQSVGAVVRCFVAEGLRSLEKREAAR
jgi:hypothetical protein